MKTTNTNLDTIPLTNITRLLRPGEELVHTYRPHPKAYFFSQLFRISPFVVMWLCFDLFAIFSVFFGSDIDWSIIPIMMIFFGFHMLPVWIWLYGFIKDISACKYTEYYITTQRIIIKSGKEQSDIITIQLKDVKALNIRVGWIDTLLSVGDLYITAKQEIAVIFDIATPKKVLKEIYALAQDERIKVQLNSKTKYTTPLTDETHK